jgi:hypothetical protein
VLPYVHNCGSSDLCALCLTCCSQSGDGTNAAGAAGAHRRHARKLKLTHFNPTNKRKRAPAARRLDATTSILIKAELYLDLLESQPASPSCAQHVKRYRSVTCGVTYAAVARLSSVADAAASPTFAARTARDAAAVSLGLMSARGGVRSCCWTARAALL